MVDINAIKSRGKIDFGPRQPYYPLDFNFLSRIQTGKFQCAYCGVFVSTKALSKDHVYPKSKGGTFTTSSCKRCNDAKKDMLPIAWAIYAYENDIDIGSAICRQESRTQ